MQGSRRSSTRRGSRSGGLTCAVVAACVAAGAPLRAADWTGLVNTNWDTGGNWTTGVVPGPTEAARFGFGAATPSGAIVVSGSRTIGSIAMSGSQAYALQWPQSATLSVTNDVALQSSSGSITSFWGGTASVKNLTLSNSAKGEVRPFTAFNVSGTTSLSGTSALQVFAGGSLTTNSLSMSGSTTFSVNGNNAAASVANVNLSENALLSSLLGTLSLSGSIVAKDQSRIVMGPTGGLAVAPGTSLSFMGAGAYLALHRGWTMPPGGILAAVGGGDVNASQSFGVGVNSSATLQLVGLGSTLTMSGSPDSSLDFFTDFGSGSGASATVSISTNAGAILQNVRIGHLNAAASVNVASQAHLTANRELVVGGGTATRSVRLEIAGGTVNAIGGLVVDHQGIVDLSSGNLRIFADSEIRAGGRLNWSGGTLNISNAWLTVGQGASLDRPDAEHELTAASTLRIVAGGTSSGTGGMNLARTVSSGTLYVAGAGSLFSATGTSTWARLARRGVFVTIEDGGRVDLGALVAGEGDEATLFLTVRSGGQLAVQSLRMGGFAAGNAVAGRAVASVDSVLPSGGAALSVAGDAALQKGTVVTLTAGTIAVGGALSLSGDARIVPATTTSTGAIRAATLQMEPTASIDLARGTLAITQVAPSTLESISGLIRAGFNGGTWSGKGVTSSAVAATSGWGVGYRVDSAGLLVVALPYGDANADRSVNFDDLLFLAANYNQSGKHWFDGDFTYDGVVNFDDLLKLAANYNQSISGSLGGDWALAQASVPEPAAGVFAAMFAQTVLRRRRRTRD